MLKDVNHWSDYVVDENGMVYRKKDGLEIKQYLQKSGYTAVYLKDNNGWISAVPVHRIVAEAFLPPVEGKPFVDHINTNRADNRICNLRWASPKDNANNEQTKQNKKKRLTNKNKKL